MNNAQKQILKNFIIEFLPRTHNQRKYSGNELEYVFTTLNKVFIQNFGFKLTKEAITDCFFKLNYQIFNKNGIFDLESSLTKPTFIDEDYFLSPKCFVYFDIDPKTIRQLMLTTSKLQKNISPEKINNTKKMKSKLESFK